MACHSKWSNIKRKKGAADAKRSKMFSKAIKEINVAIKEGGSPDPDANPALRNAILNARGINMPKDNIENAIKKASGEGGENFERVTFEGYGPHGVAFLIECTTDNTNRTVAIIRSIFTKSGGSLGKNGSVEFLFERKGIFTIEKKNISMPFDELELSLIENGLESLENEEEDDFIRIITPFGEFGNMSKALEDLNIETQNALVEYLPMTTVTLPIEQAEKIIELEEKFEDEDDVQNVFHNLEMTDEFIATLENA